MVAQQSGSTISTNVMLDHADLILSAIEANDEKEWVRKIVIPAESKVDFLTSLRRMNVTANSLFPGIDGFGRSVGELTRLELSFTDKEGE